MEIKRLSDLRKGKGLSQKKLASFLAISSASVGMYETGKRTPPLCTAIKIAKFFDIPVEYISFANKNLNT